MREFLEKVSERMLKLQLEEDKELQKEIKQRDSLFILLEKMVGTRIMLIETRKDFQIRNSNFTLLSTFS